MPCHDSRTNSVQYIDRIPADYADLKQRLDHATRVACALHRFAVGEGKLKDEEVGTWWTEHQQDDLKRELEAALDATLAERKRVLEIIKRHSGGLHCCELDYDGNVVKTERCTCWRSAIVTEINA